MGLRASFCALRLIPACSGSLPLQGVVAVGTWIEEQAQSNPKALLSGGQAARPCLVVIIIIILKNTTIAIWLKKKKNFARFLKMNFLPFFFFFFFLFLENEMSFLTG